MDLGVPVRHDQIHAIDPIDPIPGGITANTGIALSRLGIRTGLLTYVGDDLWGRLLHERFTNEGLMLHQVQTHATDPTTTVVVLIDAEGRRSFLVPGVKTATKSIDASFVMKALPTLANASFFVLGYFGRMPALEPDLPEVLNAIRATGCRTAMDTAGQGGDRELLKRVLPHLDVYIPSEIEARHQTGDSNPRQMVSQYRAVNDHGLLGVKLGERGALLHHPAEGWIEVSSCRPPGPVIDTTGAGDCFLAGLLAGLIAGESIEDASRRASAAGACAVSQRGGFVGVPVRAAFEAFLRGQ